MRRSAALSTMPGAQPHAEGGSPPCELRSRRRYGRRAKSSRARALATGLTVAGVAAAYLGALAALPDAIYWLPEALTEGG